MNIYIARLHGMLDPNGIWNLNDEDRAAIQYILKAFETVKQERDTLAKIIGEHNKTIINEVPE